MLWLCLSWLRLASADSGYPNSNATDNDVVWSSLLLNGLGNKCCQTWILSILASCVVGLTGIVPLLFIPLGCEEKLQQKGSSGGFLRALLSFAVGGLLGDVFLHLLPEAWNNIDNFGGDHHWGHTKLGLWVLIGIFSFVCLEIIFAASQEPTLEPKTYDQTSPKESCNGHSQYHETQTRLRSASATNGSAKVPSNGYAVKTKQTIHVAGYLNLMANSIDNFAHGLAVGGSFIVGAKMGMLTTFAILLHEIPHEIGDFAILLKSGFDPWNAAKAQLSTATIGMLGAVVALTAESSQALGSCTSWILPFTAGGFLNIALVNVLPDLLKENNPWESLKQLTCLVSGITSMALVTFYTH